MSNNMYELFEKTIIQLGLPVPTREYRFLSRRKWRIDFAWPEHKLAVEIEGGAFMNKHGIQGRHVRGAGFRSDIKKYNEIAMQGYTLLRFMPEQLMSYGIDLLERFFKENNLKYLPPQGGSIVPKL